MQTTFDRSKWYEDHLAEKRRDELDQKTDPAAVRQLFPFKARAKKKLMAYGILEGTVFEYARTKMVANFYPIEIMVGIAGDTSNHIPRKLCVSSDEVQLIEA